MTGRLKSILQMPARVAAVAGVTLTQLVRMRLFLVPAVVALLFLALQFVPYQENISMEYQGVAQLQFLKDVCLGCMHLFGLVFCVAATALLIPRDTEDRILYTILCKPVPRFDYLLGKALGVVLLLVLMLGVMDALMSLLLHLRGSAIEAELVGALSAHGYAAEEMRPYLEQVREAGNSWNLQLGILASLLGYGVLTGFTLLISCCTSGSIVSIIFALGGYFVGMFRGSLFAMFASGGEGTSPFMRGAEAVFRVLLPDFSIFAVADTAAAGAPLTWGMLGTLALIAIGYLMLHVVTAAWIFSRKEF